MDAHVLRGVEARHKIEIGKVNGAGATVGSGEDGVYGDLECGEIAGIGVGFAVVSETVTADSEADRIRVFFLGSVTGDDAKIRDSCVTRDVGFGNEAEGVAAGGIVRRKALGKAPDFFGTG